MKSKFRTAIPLLLLGLSYLYLFLFPKQASTAIAEGLQLCIRTIIPSMFPYFVLSDWFINLGCADYLGRKLNKFMTKAFHISGQGASALLIGVIGGYPLGAKTVSDLRRKNTISDSDANKLLTFCCNAGPAFAIGVVGNTLYDSTIIGLALFGIQILSAFLVGFLPFPNHKANCRIEMSINNNPKIPKVIVDGVTNGAKNIIKVCAFILLFSIFITLENSILFSKPVLQSFVNAVTELSSGCTVLAAANISWQLKFSATAAAISFGGLCVLFQTMSVISDVGLSIKPYLFGKLLQVLFSFIIAYPVSFIFTPMTAAGNFPIYVYAFSPFPWFFLSFGLLFLIFLQIPSSISRHSRL